MHLVKQFRYTLDFVHGHPVLVALRYPVSEPLWRGEQFRIHLMIEHVEEQRAWKLLVQPGGLAHPARTEEKKALPRRRLEQSWTHNSFLL
jgi:hypothetical protein